MKKVKSSVQFVLSIVSSWRFLYLAFGSMFLFEKFTYAFLC